MIDVRHGNAVSVVLAVQRRVGLRAEVERHVPVGRHADGDAGRACPDGCRLSPLGMSGHRVEVVVDEVADSEVARRRRRGADREHRLVAFVDEVQCSRDADGRLARGRCRGAERHQHQQRRCKDGRQGCNPRPACRATTRTVNCKHPLAPQMPGTVPAKELRVPRSVSEVKTVSARLRVISTPRICRFRRLEFACFDAGRVARPEGELQPRRRGAAGLLLHIEPVVARLPGRASTPQRCEGLPTCTGWRHTDPGQKTDVAISLWLNS